MPWEPRHSDSYVLKGWEALRPSRRPLVWVLLNLRTVWRERAAWRRLLEHDKQEREKARLEARRLAAEDFRARFSKKAN